MNCRHEYCIYNKDCECTLDRIELDDTGMCCACIVVGIEEDLLEMLKKRKRREIEEE